MCSVQSTLWVNNFNQPNVHRMIFANASVKNRQKQSNDWYNFVLYQTVFNLGALLRL